MRFRKNYILFPEAFGLLGIVLEMAAPAILSVFLLSLQDSDCRNLAAQRTQQPGLLSEAGNESIRRE
jgi:hypothetical protein